MVAFICTLLVGFAGVAAVVLFGRRRPVGAPLSWGEAMAAAVFAMLLFVWWYAVIPHQWLTWAGNELGWRTDKLLLEPTGNQPLTVSYQAVRDLVAVVIYSVELLAMGVLWVKWQKRGQTAPVAVEKSEFGRPLVKKS